MSKKLYTGLVPLLAVVAFAMVPAAAQATQCKTSAAVVGPCPHFYIGGSKVGVAPGKETLAWGTLSLTSAAGDITCSNAVLAEEYNPAVVKPATESAAGEDDTLAFGSGNCVDETCPGVAYVQPVDLPWPSELIVNGKGEVQDESYNVHVIIGCENPTKKGSGTGFAPNGGEILGAVEFETNANNKQTPTTINGASGCNKPSEIEFGAESGHLSALGEEVIGSTSGNLKTCGYEKNNLATTSTP